MTAQIMPSISSGRVLITGASSGIGAQLAKDYVAAGWQVFGCGRSYERLIEIKDIAPLVFDVSVRDQVQCAAVELDNVLDGFKLDLIILNAGGCEYIDDPIYFDDQLFERVIQTNLVSVGYCLNAFLPKLSRRGRLAIMSSSATFLPLPRAEAYGASKAALNYLAQTLAADFQRGAQTREMRVTLICPGFVNTPLTAKNDFPMPMAIDVEQASLRIRNGLACGLDEIHFPKRFTLFLKLIALLPGAIRRRLIVAMTGRPKQPNAKQPNAKGKDETESNPTPQQNKDMTQ